MTQMEYRNQFNSKFLKVTNQPPILLYVKRVSDKITNIQII